MKNRTSIVAFLLFALLGAAMAFIRPAQPVQVDQPNVGDEVSMFGLDNPAIEVDSNIHPARKCGFCMG